LEEKTRVRMQLFKNRPSPLPRRRAGGTVGPKLDEMDLLLDFIGAQKAPKLAAIGVPPKIRRSMNAHVFAAQRPAVGPSSFFVG